VANQGLSTESWVFLRRETTNPEGSSKLDELADGPYRVVKSEGHTVVLRIGDDDVLVSKNRGTRARKPLAEVPIAGDSPVANPTGNVTPTQGNDANPTGNDSPEFVIDKIVGLRKANMGSGVIRFGGMAILPRMILGNQPITYQVIC
jgi:hypothetical protein